ncbi:MFS transporter [Coriobacteriia bacterium Es71-Z0120]|uniref:MFS transporter n=1 Tax=Parvivirga hydrogeniphila TaxID=2939460 RepID=UPI002260AD24|nr:MFS transporter [Parvivirga hydrogeniphila]MCL4078616.1 MFS transporter [Parvivirga hydrogeniphila]
MRETCGQDEAAAPGIGGSTATEQALDTLTAEADACGPPAGLLSRFRTFESFAHRDFALAFSGALLSNVGSWMQIVALGWIVYDLTASSQALGFVNALSGLPVTFLAVVAGALADRLDRRKLLIFAQAALMAQAIAFGVLYQTGRISMAWIYALVLVGGVFQALTSPAWQAMTPDLVPPRSLMNAVALNSAQFNAARFLGPVAGGAVFALLGVAAVFYVNAASFLFVIAALAMIRLRGQQHRRAHSDTARDVLLGGIRYAREHPRIAWLLLSAAVLTTFGMPFAALLPALAKSVLHLKETGYSLLLAANGAGALTSALVVATLSRRIRRERIIRVGYAVMGAALVILAMSRNPYLSAIVLFALGAAFLAIVSSINTSLQLSTDPQVRGRVMALFVMAFMGMMPLGSALFGWVAQRIGLQVAIAIGGAATLAYGGFLLARPSLICEGDDPC